MGVSKNVAGGMQPADLLLQKLRSTDLGHVLIIGEAFLQDQLLSGAEV